MLGFEVSISFSSLIALLENNVGLLYSYFSI